MAEPVKRLRRKLDTQDLDRMGLPRELWRTNVQGVSESVRDLVRRYLVNIDAMVTRPAGLYLFGPEGVGKSGIAALVCKEARSALFTAYWVTTWELRELVKAKIEFEEGTTVLDRCKAVDVLVLDDLSEQDQKSYAFDAHDLASLVAHRTGNQRATILTSRLPPEALAGFFPLLVSKMTGSLFNVSVEGPNLRELASLQFEAQLRGEDEHV